MSDKNKGFASMDKEKVKEIASKGGQSSNKNNNHDNNDHDNNSDNSESHNVHYDLNKSKNK